MGLKLIKKIPYGNACAINIHSNGDEVEVRFSPSPYGAAAPLWFCFRLIESTPEVPQGSRVKLILKYADTLNGIEDLVALVPVYQNNGQGWSRMRHGVVKRELDGQRQVVWNLRYPDPSIDIALCYPYGIPEIKNLVSKSKGYWKLDGIGISRRGREIIRLSNLYQSMSDHHPGIYIVARRHAGETPGSWVLDGLLRRFSMLGKTQFLVWALPLSDIDGVLHGDYPTYSSNTCDLSLQCLHLDIQRWKERCRPLLLLNLGASTIRMQGEIYSTLPPKSDAFPKLRKEAERWANTFKTALTNEFASNKFLRELTGQHVFEHHNICSLSLHFPYSQIGSTDLTLKDFRQFGKRLADAIIHRQGKL